MMAPYQQTSVLEKHAPSAGAGGMPHGHFPQDERTFAEQIADREAGKARRAQEALRRRRAELDPELVGIAPQTCPDKTKKGEPCKAKPTATGYCVGHSNARGL